jgi:hypothetical protein
MMSHNFGNFLTPLPYCHALYYWGFSTVATKFLTPPPTTVMSFMDNPLRVGRSYALYVWLFKKTGDKLLLSLTFHLYKVIFFQSNLRFLEEVGISNVVPLLSASWLRRWCPSFGVCCIFEPAVGLILECVEGSAGSVGWPAFLKIRLMEETEGMVEASQICCAISWQKKMTSLCHLFMSFKDLDLCRLFFLLILTPFKARKQDSYFKAAGAVAKIVKSLILNHLCQI